MHPLPSVNTNNASLHRTTSPGQGKATSSTAQARPVQSVELSSKVTKTLSVKKNDASSETSPLKKIFKPLAAASKTVGGVLGGYLGGAVGKKVGQFVTKVTGNKELGATVGTMAGAATGAAAGIAIGGAAPFLCPYAGGLAAAASGGSEAQAAMKS